jgi:hypothetical protein
MLHLFLCPRWCLRLLLLFGRVFCVALVLAFSHDHILQYSYSYLFGDTPLSFLLVIFCLLYVLFLCCLLLVFSWALTEYR